MPSSHSIYATRLEDPGAVYLDSPGFPVHGDGKTDDTAAIQRAIDHVQETTRQGIVFLPEGRYRLTNTVKVWPGIRIFGYGASRPTLVLAPNSPGFRERERVMVFFAGGKRQADADYAAPTADLNGKDFGMPNEANPGTFYSAMSNVDIEIGAGNPAAVGVRGRYAQHCYLAHMDFRLGDALAGIHDTGNFAEDLTFQGGQFGIITRTPSPGWQFTLLDSSFEGQSVAAIRTHETGLTLIRPHFWHVPTAILVEPGHTEQLWMKDAKLTDVKEQAISCGREESLRLQLNGENVACRDVPVFLRFKDSGKAFAGPQPRYIVQEFSHGLKIGETGKAAGVTTEFRAKAAARWPGDAPTDVAELPPTEKWANVRDFGAKGDGATDDTAAIKRALAERSAIYFPTGKYRVTETIHMKPDTALIGLHPFATQILITDNTPGFNSSEAPGGHRASPKPLVEAPSGGRNIITGIGLDTGGNNSLATALLWGSGANSMVDDVKFLGGHGSVEWSKIYNADHSGDPDSSRRWDSQYPSLWVIDGGGGTFKNLWTASTFAAAGMLVTNTKTPGRVYQLSSEHHVRSEVILRGVSNWELAALQTEEERGEGPFALPLEIQDSENVTIANLNMYRVVSVVQPFECAVRTANSKAIHFRGVHCYSNSKASFDNLLADTGAKSHIRQREFAELILDSHKLSPTPADARVGKVADAFFNISGGAVAPDGSFYFVDAVRQRIYRAEEFGDGAKLVSEARITPVNLAFDRTGNLLVVCYEGKGSVMALDLKSGRRSPVAPVPAEARPASSPFFPVTDWLIDEHILRGEPVRRPWHYLSPDGTVYLAAKQDFVDGSLTYGIKLCDTIRSFGLAEAHAGQPFYVTGESQLQTYRVDVEPDGTLTNPRLFAEQGGEGVAVGPGGNVYIAGGEIYVYSPEGKLVDTIHVPERPIQVAFGGADGKTLFIAARTSIYRARIR